MVSRTTSPLRTPLPPSPRASLRTAPPVGPCPMVVCPLTLAWSVLTNVAQRIPCCSQRRCRRAWGTVPWRPRLMAPRSSATIKSRGCRRPTWTKHSASDSASRLARIHPPCQRHPRVVASDRRSTVRRSWPPQQPCFPQMGGVMSREVTLLIGDRHGIHCIRRIDADSKSQLVPRRLEGRTRPDVPQELHERHGQQRRAPHH